MFRSNSWTKVADAEFDGATVPPRTARFGDIARAYDDSTVRLVPGLAVLDAVFDEVAEYLEDGVGVGDDFDGGDLADLEDGVVVLDQAAHRLDGFAHKHVGRNRDRVHLLFGGFDAGHDEEVFGEAVHAGRVFEDGREKLLRLRAEGGLVVEQGFDVAADGG